MLICSKCLYPENHALNIFIENNICSGCKVHNEKYEIDWKQKGEELIKIFNRYKSKKGNYDCIIPVTGGGDSFFIVDFVVNKLKGNPLLVNYNTHYNSPVGVYNLALLRSKFDNDFLQLTLDPIKIKKITRQSLIKFGSMYWHCLAGQTVFPVRVAVNYKIPLIIWGAHQGIDQVGMFSHFDNVEMSEKYRKDHDLMGYDQKNLIGEICSANDLKDFEYPSQNEILSNGIKGIYLNNYIFWDSFGQHQRMQKKYRYNMNVQNRTFDKYNYAHCLYYSDVHDYIKYLKHGYSKINDNVAREIRLRRISKSYGRKLINFYINKKPKFLDSFLKWIELTEEGFRFIVDAHRSKKAWVRNSDWEWIKTGEFTKDEKKMSIKNNLFFKYEKNISEKFSKKTLIYDKGFDINI